MTVPSRHNMNSIQCLKNTLVSLIACLPLMGPAFSSAQTTSKSLEYQVKAVYVYNFLKFVDWPPGTFSAETDPINVCVIGEHPIGDALEPIEKQTARGRPIRLHRLNPHTRVQNCQVVFVGALNSQQASTLLQSTANARALTVSDVPHFIELGGMIGFVIDGGRVALEINLREIRASQLEISAKVLEIASTVIMD